MDEPGGSIKKNMTAWFLHKTVCFEMAEGSVVVLDERQASELAMLLFDWSNGVRPPSGDNHQHEYPAVK